MAHCIPTYMLASGLMASGMSWGQALFTILLGNTIVLAPILLNSHPGTKYAGVLIADYWILRRRELNLEDLYLPDGEYRGWSWKAIGATVAGCAIAWSGVFVPALRPLYDYAWFVGFFVAGSAYVALIIFLEPRWSYNAGPARP